MSAPERGTRSSLEALLLHFARRKLGGEAIAPEAFVQCLGERAPALHGPLERIADLAGELSWKRETLRHIERQEGCRVLRLLGAGGMGEVWLAKLEASGRLVAIKTLREPLSSAQRQALDREVEAASRLDHPAIVHLIAVRDGRHPYLVMDFIEGVDVLQVMPQGPTNALVAAHLFAKIADALAFAHDRGVLHGDLKPDNVLIDEKLRPHILDFGLSCLSGTGGEFRAAGGTRGYCPPERYRQPEEQGPWSDNYSLCAMLEEAVAGQAVPRGLRRILRKGLQPKPSRRYQSASDLAHHLRRWLTIPWLPPAMTARNAARSSAVLALCGALAFLFRPAEVQALSELVPEAVCRFWSASDHNAADRLLRRALESQNKEELLSAIHAAGLWYRGSYLENLAVLASREDAEVAVAAMWALSRSPTLATLPRRTVELLATTHLESGSSSSRQAGALVRWRAGIPDRDGCVRRLLEGVYEEQRVGLRALAGSPDESDVAFVRDTALTASNATLRRCALWTLVSQGIPLGDELWSRLANDPSLMTDSGCACVPPWLSDPVIDEHLLPIDGTRDRIRERIKEAYDDAARIPDEALRASVRRRALRALSNCGRLGDLEWIVGSVASCDVEDVVLAGCEALARIHGREGGSHVSPSDAVFREALALLDAVSDHGWRGGWKALFEARMRAWIGDRDGAKRALRDAVSAGFCRYAMIAAPPLEQLAAAEGILQELRRAPARGFCSSWKRNAPVEVVRTGSFVERVRRLEVRADPIVGGWDCEVAKGSWDPAEGPDHLALTYPFESRVTLRFLVDRPVDIDAVLELGEFRAFNSSTVPSGAFAEASVILNGQSVTGNTYYRLPTSDASRFNVRNLINQGENELVIELGMSLTIAGIHSIELRCTSSE